MAGMIVPVQNGPGLGLDDPLERLLRRAEQANQIKELWRQVWQDCYDYALPQRQGLYAETEAKRRSSKIYDSTAVIGLHEFASRLQAYLAPIGSKWAEFKAGSDVPDEYVAQVNGALEPVTKKVFDILRLSNFDLQFTEFLLDLGIGTGVMSIEEGDFERPVVFTAMPQGEVALEVDPFGGTQGIFRTREVRWTDLPTIWPNGRFDREIIDKIQRAPADSKAIVVEATTRDWSRRDEERWDHSVILKNEKKVIYGGTYSGAGSCPYVVAHWAKSAGDTYGRGPVQNVLGDIMVLNTVVELMLENAERAILGMYQVDDDGVVNVENVSLLPGTVIPVAANSRGIQPIAQDQNVKWDQWVLQEMRSNIKKALYDEPLGDMQDTRIQSATEVQERTADLSRRVGAAFGRLQYEAMVPILKRVVAILKRRGIIKLPKVNGREVAIRPLAPIARQQAQEEVLRLDRMLGLIGQRLGPQYLGQMVKIPTIPEYLAENLGVPARLVNTASEIEQQQQKARQNMAAAGADGAAQAAALGPGAMAQGGTIPAASING